MGGTSVGPSTGLRDAFSVNELLRLFSGERVSAITNPNDPSQLQNGRVSIGDATKFLEAHLKRNNATLPTFGDGVTENQRFMQLFELYLTNQGISGFKLNPDKNQLVSADGKPMDATKSQRIDALRDDLHVKQGKESIGVSEVLRLFSVDRPTLKQDSRDPASPPKSEAASIDDAIKFLAKHLKEPVSKEELKKATPEGKGKILMDYFEKYLVQQGVDSIKLSDDKTKLVSKDGGPLTAEQTAEIDRIKSDLHIKKRMSIGNLAMIGLRGLASGVQAAPLQKTSFEVGLGSNQGGNGEKHSFAGMERSALRGPNPVFNQRRE